MMGQELNYLFLEEEELLKSLVHQTRLEEDLQAVLAGEPVEEDDKKKMRLDQGVVCSRGASQSDRPGQSDGAEAGGAGAVVGSIPHHTMDEFAHHHHLTKSQVEGLFMVLGPQYSNPGRRAPLKDFVITSLVVLSTKNNYRELNESRLFKSRGWMHKTIHLFCQMVVRHLSWLIEWPSGARARDTMAEFEAIAGLPGVIGALDTCHLAITKAPVGKNSKLYANPSLYHSIHLLGVCDAHSRLTYVNVGRPGSFPEARVLAMTSLYQAMTEDPTGLFPPNSHLVGDSAFPLTDHVMAPYPVGATTSKEHRNFNAKLHSTKQPIDRAFELLRARWKRLRCLEMDEVASMSHLVRCCCVLHNIASSNPGYHSLSAEDREDKEDIEVEHVGTVSAAAMQKRDMLAMYLDGQTLTLNIQ